MATRPPRGARSRYTRYHHHHRRRRGGGRLQPSLRRPDDYAALPGEASDARAAFSTSEDYMRDCRVVPKIPPFWIENPELWFARVETHFYLAGIVSDEAKFNAVASQLDRRSAAPVERIHLAAPPERKYETLKHHLISNKPERQPPVAPIAAKGAKPSVLLNGSREMMGVSVSEKSLGHYWLGRLPAEVKAAIAPLWDRVPLGVLALTADDAWETLEAPAPAPVPAPVPVPAVVSAAATAAAADDGDVAMFSDNPDIIRLQKKVQKLTLRVQQLTAASEEASICWYHRTHTVYANKCAPPCNYMQTCVPRPNYILDGGAGTRTDVPTRTETLE